jgi:glycolate oxidase subunit GlcD
MPEAAVPAKAVANALAAALGEIRALVGADGVVVEARRLLAYESDANPLFRGAPAAVVLPRTPHEAARVLAILAAHGVPFLPRGAGTGLSGGAVATAGEVVVSLSRLVAIEAVDVENEAAIVQTGVTNARVSAAVAAEGRFYAPDPSSQAACTIGGNLAENSGGSHCLKYGVTLNHVRFADVVFPDGEEVRLGGLAPDGWGYDLLGLFIGSEGTLGTATRAGLGLSRVPRAVRTVLALFESVPDASRAVSAVIAAGIVPAAMEMMDNLAMAGVERGPYKVGFPPDAGAVLLIEVDGREESVAVAAARIEQICLGRGLMSVRVAASPEERALWWANRKTAFGAMANLARSYYVQDGVVPRSRLPQVLDEVAAVGRRYELRIANVFHAGDGNLHPLILFDDSRPAERERAVAAGTEILAACVAHGGSVTGEHGVGLEKRAEMALMFTPAELALQDRVRRVFDPSSLANRGKVLPSGGDGLGPR